MPPFGNAPLPNPRQQVPTDPGGYQVDYRKPAGPTPRGQTPVNYNTYRTAPMPMWEAMDPNWAWHGPPAGRPGVQLQQVRAVNQPPMVQVMPGVYADPYNPMVQALQRPVLPHGSAASRFAQHAKGGLIGTGAGMLYDIMAQQFGWPMLPSMPQYPEMSAPLRGQSPQYGATGKPLSKSSYGKGKKK